MPINPTRSPIAHPPFFVQRKPLLVRLTLCLTIALLGSPLLRADEPTPRYEVIRDVAYDQPENAKPLLADLYRPSGKGPFPGVLLIHGGAWMSGNKDQLAWIAHGLAQTGFTVMAINYRLAPEHQYPAQLDDCRKAIAWMQKKSAEHKIDPQKLATWGYSAGGHLALLLGLESPEVCAVVAGGAPVDFRKLPLDSPYLQYWLGDTRRNRPEIYDDASPATHVSSRAATVFFYHGVQDRWVPYAPVEKMAKSLEKLGVSTRLYPFPNSGHLHTMGAPKPALEGLRWLARYMREPAEPEQAKESIASKPVPR